MFSAYLFHFVNLSVAFLMVPLLLHYLNAAEYALWLVFSAFGGLTIHMQNAIQNSAVKEIARGVHLGEELDKALQRMRSAYAGLAIFVAGPYLCVGLIYLHQYGAGNYTLEWSIFVASFAAVYAIAPRHCILLGSDRVEVSNRINTLTRVLYFVVAFGLLELGYSILAICFAFVISTLVSAVLSMYSTRNHENPLWKWSLSKNVPRYGLFTVTAFALYNGAYLVAAALFPDELVASYGLGLQVGLYLMTLSLAPLQVWLARLVRAISTGREKIELLRSIVVVDLIFLMGAVFLLFFGNSLLAIVGSRIYLPEYLELIFLAYFVELNIAVLVNFSMAMGNYRFVKIYVPLALLGLTLGIILAAITGNLISFIAVPVGIQALICLPLVARAVVTGSGEKLPVNTNVDDAACISRKS